jgi:hypothetical protein
MARYGPQTRYIPLSLFCTNYHNILKSIACVIHILVFQVLGPVVHPWLDQSKRVIGSTKLLTWNPSTSSLSETTKEIIQALAGAPQTQTSTSNKEINPNSSLPVEVVEGKAKWVPSPPDNVIKS